MQHSDLNSVLLVLQHKHSATLLRFELYRRLSLCAGPRLIEIAHQLEEEEEEEELASVPCGGTVNHSIFQGGAVQGDIGRIRTVKRHPPPPHSRDTPRGGL